MCQPSVAKVCGIICEYNPFHQGHAYHIAKAHEASGGALILCVMSGPFTQRGKGAVLAPGTRAEMALKAGADVVVELPCCYALREAEHFALGGVSLLQALGAQMISFGCENEDISLLWKAAEVLEAPTPSFSETLRAGLMAGEPHPKAQAQALRSVLGEAADVLRQPNNTLALCYLRALLRTGAEMTPVPVLRRGGYHDSGWQEGFPSATAVREALRRGDWQSLRHMVPASAWGPMEKALLAGEIHCPEALDAVLRYRLRQLDGEALRRYPNVSEGLENRIISHRDKYIEGEALLQALKTKRYTYGRLSRLMSHILLNMTKERLEGCVPESFRLLGFRERARPFIVCNKEKLYEKAARKAVDEAFLLDMEAYDLWAMGAEQPLGLGYRQSPIYVAEP